MDKKNNTDKLRKILNQNKYLINIIIILLGIVASILGVVIANVTVSQILLNIGLSFVSSGIISIITIAVIDSNEKEEDKELTSWGLEQIYATRSEMNSHTATVFPTMKKEYCQIAFGVKSLRDAYDSLFMDKVKHGLKVKFITMHPNSEFLKERELVENKQKGEIRKTIIDLIKWIEKLQKNAKKASNIQIKFYDSLPLDFYCKIDDNLYVGPYLYGKESQQTISYRFSPNGKSFNYYVKYFDTLWNSSIMKDLAEVKKEINNENQF